MEPGRFDLTGKVALVTGASRGIGAEAALTLAGAGADLCLASRDRAGLERVAARIEAMGRRALVRPIDLARIGEIPVMVEGAVRELGRLDILVNNAGTNIRRPALDFTEADWDRVVTLNLKAAFFCAQAAGRVMAAQKSGKVINIVSLAVRHGLPNLAVYTAAKAGLAGLTRVLAVEWAPHGVQVNAIGPGYLRTELTEPLFAQPGWLERALGRIPAGRTGVPADLAGLLLFLASPASDYVTGQVIFVDGGWTAM